MKFKLNCFKTDLDGADNLPDISVSDKVFKYPFNPSLIHQVVSSYLINARQGSKAQKSKSEVIGSNKKPWRQKGTGRARSGSVKSPIWRSGGVTFAAQPKKYFQKINRKMYRGAIKSILSKLVQDHRLFFIENLFVKQIKTKFFLEKVKKVVSDKSVLIITDDIDKNILLSSRNLYKISIKDVSDIDPISLINFEIILITVASINKLENQLI